jgi:quercetin dioxygenase-like cupin family protein
VVATAAETKAEPLANGVGSVKNLIQGGGPRPMSLSLLELTDGAELQGKGDAPSTELLYVVAGGGNVRVGGETSTLAPETMIYVPRGTAYALKVTPGEKGDKILVVQFKVPAAGGKPRTTAPAPATPKK